jgi:hypothetical protein
MTYEESMRLMYRYVNVIETNGNEKFPYFINRLLVMPATRNDSTEDCIIESVIDHETDFKTAFKTCDIKEENFDVYVYTKTMTAAGRPIRPFLLSEYLS